MSSRRARRRNERQRAKRGRTAHPISIPVRVLLLVAGIGLLVGGGVLLTHPAASTTSARLARVAGIMLVIGVVLLIAAALGRL